jgi:hypothetical protein
MGKLCPSAQPGMDRCKVLGVVRLEGDTPIVEYLKQSLPATPEVLAMTAPLNPTEVIRLSATCEEQKCPHYDGKDCMLAGRIVQILPAVVDTLPPCTIRKECRWYFQEGSEACKRCPQVTTISYDLSAQMQEVSGLPVVQETIRLAPAEL